jgi:protein gp37
MRAVAKSEIQWCDAVWNPTRGCARVSPGCGTGTAGGCYAERQAHRFSGKGQSYEGLTILGKHGPRWVGNARFVPEKLGEPLKWRKPQRVFVNSMSDLFHSDITNEQIAAVFGVMAACPRHTFQCLTKRPERMLEWFRWVQCQSETPSGAEMFVQQCAYNLLGDRFPLHPIKGTFKRYPWPLRGVHLGVSCEDQQRADERIPLLLQCPAAVRWVSYEPALEAVDFTRYLKPTLVSADGRRLQHPDPAVPNTGGTWEFGLDWLVAGGESGPNARQCSVDWIRDVVRQCQHASVPVFCKQLGSAYVDAENGVGGHRCPAVIPDYGAITRLKDRKGGDPSEWPESLRVREFPA